MLAIAHILVAGAITKTIPDPVIAPTLCLASHFILDSIPHWDLGTNWRGRSKLKTGLGAAGEMLISFGIGFMLFGPTVPFFLLSTSFIASVLPDLMEAPWYIFFARQDKFKPAKRAGFWEKFTFRIYKTQNKFHTKAKNVIFGLATQIIAVAFFLILLR